MSVEKPMRGPGPRRGAGHRYALSVPKPLPTVAVAALAAVLLSGCSAGGPSRDTLVDRFAIELEGGSDGVLERDSTQVRDLAEGLADDALDGSCGEPTYWAGLGDATGLLYAWSATCSMYFDEQMNATLRDHAKDILLEQVKTKLQN